ALAAPLGVAAAVFLAELAPRALRQPLNSMVSLLAAVPSVVYGLWGIFALVPWLGFGYASASLILAIMIVPYIVSLAREALAAVPRQQAEAAYALGATRWEVIGRVLLPAARSGIAGGVALAMARAGRNHGGDDGDREPAGGGRCPVRARHHPGQRHRQRVHRGHLAALHRGAD